jgi:2-isopropylmalate synthase
VEFSGAVQRLTDETGQEVDARQLWALFEREYLTVAAPLRYVAHELFAAHGGQGVRLVVEVNGRPMTLAGEGNGPVAAAVAALRLPFAVHGFEERALGDGADAAAMAMVEMALEGVPGSCFGAGMDRNTVTASLRALISAANRLLARGAVTDLAALSLGE